jgi:hypothetical protein
MPFNVGFGSFGGHGGSVPSPFDALNGPRLAGPDGSHPLHDVRAEELLRPSDGVVARARPWPATVALSPRSVGSASWTWILVTPGMNRSSIKGVTAEIGRWPSCRLGN